MQQRLELEGEKLDRSEAARFCAEERLVTAEQQLRMMEQSRGAVGKKAKTKERKAQSPQAAPTWAWVGGSPRSPAARSTPLLKRATSATQKSPPEAGQIFGGGAARKGSNAGSALLGTKPGMAQRPALPEQEQLMAHGPTRERPVA